MPRQRLYASAAEKQAAYNERKRQAERERLQAVAEEQRRISAMKQDVRQRIGRGIERKVTTFSIALREFLRWEDIDGVPQEVRDYVKEIARAMQTGSNYIP